MTTSALDLDGIVPNGKGELAVLDHTGDTKTLWDPDNAVEIEIAEENFKKFRKKGYLAYKVSEDGKKGEMITTFDPKAGRIIMSPPQVGG